MEYGRILMGMERWILILGQLLQRYGWEEYGEEEEMDLRYPRTELNWRDDSEETSEIDDEAPHERVEIPDDVVVYDSDDDMPELEDAVDT